MSEYHCAASLKSPRLASYCRCPDDSRRLPESCTHWLNWPTRNAWNSFSSAAERLALEESPPENESSELEPLDPEASPEELEPAESPSLDDSPEAESFKPASFVAADSTFVTATSAERPTSVKKLDCANEDEFETPEDSSVAPAEEVSLEEPLMSAPIMPPDDEELLFSTYEAAYELGAEKPGKSTAYIIELENRSTNENVMSDAADGASFTRLRGLTTGTSPPNLFKPHPPSSSNHTQCINNYVWNRNACQASPPMHIKRIPLPGRVPRQGRARANACTGLVSKHSCEKTDPCIPKSA